MRDKVKAAIRALSIMFIIIGITGVATAQDPIEKPKRPTTQQTKPKQTTTQQTKPKQTTQQRKQVVSGTISGHDYVNLGLSVKWATVNIGASRPSDYGNYYAWGETSTKSVYTDENSKWYVVSDEDLQSRGVIGSNGNLRPQYDTARQRWGGSWRLPTNGEIEELLNRCTWKWTTEGGYNGYKVTGPNGNSIFLPAAGDRLSSDLRSAGSCGFYWSATAIGGAYGAYGLGFYSSDHYSSGSSRSSGLSIRPVTE